MTRRRSEEDPTDYLADRGDDHDDAEDEHLAPSDPAIRDALPSPVHETEMPEICLPLRKRPCRTTPGPGYEVGESSAAGTARQVGPTTARADLYGFADMLDGGTKTPNAKELGYGNYGYIGMTFRGHPEIAPTTPRGGQSESTGVDNYCCPRG
ncbi:hypothetical protein Tco_1309688 [Tanacetum coccineum]